MVDRGGMDLHACKSCREHWRLTTNFVGGGGMNPGSCMQCCRKQRELVLRTRARNQCWSLTRCSRLSSVTEACSSLRAFSQTFVSMLDRGASSSSPNTSLISKVVVTSSPSPLVLAVESSCVPYMPCVEKNSAAHLMPKISGTDSKASSAQMQ